MNKRIQQLKEQAMEWVPNQVDPDTKIRLLNAEKFAELIAYECIDLALGSSHREDDMGAIIANKIKQYFGVEE
jgi:hypothetical protein